MNRALLFFLSIVMAAASAVNGMANDTSFSGPDAQYLSLSKKYALKDDGSVVFQYREEIRLLNHFAFHRLHGEKFIVYNPEFQSLSINEAYTIMANGQKVPLPDNALNEVLPRAAENAPFANRLREMVVTRTALETGATIVLDYTLITRPGLIPFMMGMEQLAESGPIKELSLHIEVPEAIPLNFRLYHASQNPVFKRDLGIKSYHWTFTDIPAYLPENHQPEPSRFLPNLVFSTASTLQQSLVPFTGQTAFQLEANASMQQEANALCMTKNASLLKAMALQEKVIKDFKLFNLTPDQLGYRVRTPEETWKSAGGTEIEKALLLMSYLKTVQVQSELVTYYPGYFDEGLAHLPGFAHFHVLVLLPGEDPILLSIKELNPHNLLMTDLPGEYIPINTKGRLMPLVRKTTPALIRIQGKFTLSTDNSITGNTSLQFEGPKNDYLGMSRDPKNAGTGIKGSISTADFKEINIVDLVEDLCEIKANISKKEALKRSGDFGFFTWPSSNKGLSTFEGEALGTERHNPFSFPGTYTESYSYELILPPGQKLVNPVTTFMLINDAGKFIVECRQEGDKVKFFKEITLKPAQAQAPVMKNYQHFKELINTWNTDAYKISIISP